MQDIELICKKIKQNKNKNSNPAHDIRDTNDQHFGAVHLRS
jgi:hypothetical protein